MAQLSNQAQPVPICREEEERMTRSEYRNVMESSLQTMEDRITVLETRIRNMSDKSALQHLLDEVKSKHQRMRARLRRAGTATDSAWSELKRGLDGAWTELERTYERFRAQLAGASSTH